MEWETQLPCQQVPGPGQAAAPAALVNYDRDFVNHSVKTPSRNFLADPIRLPFRNIIQHVSSISRKIRTVTDQILM